VSETTIQCTFCFESFEVFLEVSDDFSGSNSEIYDCEVCCNPNKIDYRANLGEITVTQVSDGNA